MKNVRLAFALLCILCINFFMKDSHAAPDSFHLQHIVIEGNTRIERDTILSQIDLKIGQNYTYDELDKALKKLYNSGFFADAALRLDQQHW